MPLMNIMPFVKKAISEYDKAYQQLQSSQDEWHAMNPLIALCSVGTLAESVHAAGITKTALIVVGDFLGTRYERSRLYDPAFTTEFRKGADA